MSSFLDSLSSLADEMEALRKEYVRRGEAEVKKALTGFFDHFPELEQIVWSQWTPYFNDGEACVFQVHDVYLVTKDGEEEDAGWDDSGTISDELDSARRKLNLLWSQMEDVLLHVFGDHVRVVVSRSGIQVEEYEDHD